MSLFFSLLNSVHWKLCLTFGTFSSVRLEQGTVTSLLEENGTIKGVQFKSKDGKELTAYAPLTIVCDGCFSNLRRSLCSPKVWFPLSLTCRAKNISDIVEFSLNYHILALLRILIIPIVTAK